jgi:phage host-nuclease inhibitor protein Gam
MLMNEAYGTFIKTREESDSESISNNEDNSNGLINNLVGRYLSYFINILITSMTINILFIIHHNT